MTLCVYARTYDISFFPTKPIGRYSVEYRSVNVTLAAGGQFEQITETIQNPVCQEQFKIGAIKKCIADEVNMKKWLLYFASRI